MLENLSKYWKVSLAILVIVAIIVYSIYKWGKRNAEGPQVSYKGGKNDLPASWNPQPLARELYDALNGVFVLSNTKSIVFTKVLNLGTDDMIRSVYNAFNQLYFSEGSGTLTKWLRDEISVPFDGTRGELVNRLVSLGCS